MYNAFFCKISLNFFFHFQEKTLTLRCRANLLHRDSPPKNLKTCLKTPKNCLTKVFFNQIYGLSLQRNCLEKRKIFIYPVNISLLNKF